jgi:hypothetical protein
MPAGIRAHFISSGWSLSLAAAALPHVLRNIPIELIEAPGFIANRSPLLPHTKPA